MDILSLRDSLFDDRLEEHPIADPLETETYRRRPAREPIFSVETLMEGRSAFAAVLEDATPFVRR